MGRFANSGFGVDAVDDDVVAADAWSAAFDNADINDDKEQDLDIGDDDRDAREDDLLSLIAQRPSRRSRGNHRA